MPTSATFSARFCYLDGACIREAIGTDASCTLSAKDVGHRLRVRVAACNGAGRSTVSSRPARIITS